MVHEEVSTAICVAPFKSVGEIRIGSVYLPYGSSFCEIELKRRGAFLKGVQE
jgi:hypothetical protein